MSVLEAREVGKVIEGVPLLQSISFVCEAGQAIAVVGKNGSGKSTLLKILAGIHEPSRGHVIRQVKRVGYVPEQFPQNLRFKVKEYLRLVSTFHKMPNEITELEIAKYAQLFGIGPYLQSPLQRVSKGTKSVVCPIASTIHVLLGEMARLPICSRLIDRICHWVSDPHR